MTRNKFLLAAAAAAALLSACAQQPAKPEAAAAAPVAELSPQDRINFFVDHVRQGRIDLARQDLDGGIAINGIDSLGQTALIAATSHNQLEELQLLLQHGADPKIADNAGWAPLHYAAWSGSGTVIISALLDHGADINQRNDRGITPLYFAAATGHDSQVTFLLQKGADRSIASKNGYTPLRVAEVRGFYTTAKLIDPTAQPPVASAAPAPAAPAATGGSGGGH
jgi:uncharacterized protein